MKASIIKIGNSRGIRIPKTLLEESGIEESVDIKLKSGTIVISPVKKDANTYNDEYLMSLSSLKDWNDPREDEAWASLQ